MKLYFIKEYNKNLKIKKLNGENTHTNTSTI